MNRYLDAMNVSAPLAAPAIIEQTPPDIRFGCEVDLFDECDGDAEDAALRREAVAPMDQRRFRLVGRRPEGIPAGYIVGGRTVLDASEGPAGQEGSAARNRVLEGRTLAYLAGSAGPGAAAHRS